LAFLSVLRGRAIGGLLIGLLASACDAPPSAVAPTAFDSRTYAVRVSWSTQTHAGRLSDCPYSLVAPSAPRPNYSSLRSADGVIRDPGLYSYDSSGWILSGEPEFLHDADGGFTVKPKYGLILAFSVENILGDLRCTFEFMPPDTLGMEQIVLTIDRSSQGLEPSLLAIPIKVKK
jgi:hypothetical protein